APEHPRLHPALEDLAHEALRSSDDLRRVARLEIGEVAQLGVDEAMHRREGRGADPAPAPLHPQIEGAHRIAILLESGLAALDELDHGGAHDAAEQLFLVREVEVDRALRDARQLGDVLESRRRESALREHREGGVEDLLGALFRKAAPAWFGSGMLGHSLVTDWSVMKWPPGGRVPGDNTHYC